MEKLIKLQNVIMEIECRLATGLKSDFDYKRENEMEIEAYSFDHAVLIKKIADMMLENKVTYMLSNTKIQIITWE